MSTQLDKVYKVSFLSFEHSLSVNLRLVKIFSFQRLSFFYYLSNCESFIKNEAVHRTSG